MSPRPRSSLPVTGPAGMPSPATGTALSRTVPVRARATSPADGVGASTIPSAGPNAQYAAARAQALKAQAKRKPADPQKTGSQTDPRAAVAEMMRPCTCSHPALNHWQTPAGHVTWCSIATADGPCGCESYELAGATA